jgi:hypothetical protein
MVERGNEVSVVCRFEHHGSHPGVHIHSDCARSGIETGTTGLGGLDRFPKNGSHHRRTTSWTETTFWEAAKRFYRVAVKNGPLFEF